MADGPRERERWNSQRGFVLAAIGSAVGLGNMWRFSYLAAESGGAAFFVLYLAMTVLVGLPVLLAEFVLGRGAHRSPILALAHYGGNAWRPLGGLFVASGFLILSYYSVIAGWTVRYALVGLFTGFASDSSAYFEAIASGGAAVAWHLGFMALTVAVVAGGVKGGIERTNVVLMPLLFVLLIGLAVYAATLPGASAGYAYYLRPRLDEIMSFSVLTQAAGQAFFSLSLGMGAMLTYASYLERDQHLPNESLQIVSADFLVAFVAGLVVFPVLFALGLQEAVGESTVGALFITLPGAFASMGVAGRIVGTLFFATLVMGALTSAISLLEQVVATVMDSFGWPRLSSAVGIGIVIAILGCAPAHNLDVLAFMDQLAGNVFLVAGGLGLAVFVGWFMHDPIGEAAQGAPDVGWFPLWQGLLRFVAPVVLAIVLFNALPPLITSLRALFG